jgi:H+/Cl- antiporter ClcA
MVALGLTQLIASRVSRGRADENGSLPLFLCIIGLLGVFAVGYPGYFVFNTIWPNFYYSPVQVGKNAWLLWQAAFIGVYFVGAVLAFTRVRRALNDIPVAPTGQRPGERAPFPLSALCGHCLLHCICLLSGIEPTHAAHQLTFAFDPKRWTRQGRQGDTLCQRKIGCRGTS